MTRRQKVGKGRRIETLTTNTIPASQKEFHTIRQGTVSNTLTKMTTKEGRNTEVNTITRTAITTKGELQLALFNYTGGLRGFRTTTYQLLDTLTVVLTEGGAKHRKLSLSIKDLARMRGLKDLKALRQQVEEDLNAIWNSEITYKKTKIRILSAMTEDKPIKNGFLYVSFTEEFYNLLLGYPVMPYPEQLLEINSKKNPNSYYFLRKISEHKNMNVGKPNEDILSVETLLASSSEMPTIEEVMQAGQHVDQRIISRFERDMDAIADTLTWEYCHSNATPLTDEEISSMNYETFKNLLIKITWNNYPDQTARLERKAERIAKAKRKKKTSKK
jgi:hypothetical protein